VGRDGDGTRRGLTRLGLRGAGRETVKAGRARRRNKNVHQCADCGANLTTAGALALHETTTHELKAMAAPAPVATRGPSTGRRNSPGPARRVLVGTITLATVLIVALLLGVGARAAYRSIAKSVASDSASDHPAAAPSQPSPPAGQHSAPAPASPPASAAGAPSGAVAAARQKYLAVAAAYSAAMKHASDGLPTLSNEVWSRYATALRSYDAGLRAIAFPASVRPAVAALLADDAQMEGWFDRMTSDPGCSCSGAISLKPKIAADVDRLRAALGLPADPASTEPGH